MIILGFDSTAKAASVAVSDDERLLATYTIDNGLTQSELLLPMAQNILKSLKLTFSDISLLAVSVGPGSFTGVRIGAALVKGIAFGKNIPCVSLSTLDGLCENLRGLQGVIVPCMDARRNQVYTATYLSDGVNIEKLTEDRAIPIEQLADELKAYADKSIYIVGDGYLGTKKALLELGVNTENTPELLLNENAFSLCKLAYKKYLSGEFTDDTTLTPTYLRMPQAERERLERLQNN